MELTIEQALQQGVTAHNQGNLQEAERLYRAILQVQPAHPDANHNLGVIAISVNRAAAALPLFKLALDVNPKIEQFWLSYVDALIKDKQFETAKKILEQCKKEGFASDKFNALAAQLTIQGQAQKEPVGLPAPPQAELNNLLEHYQNGRFDVATKLAVSITKQFPNNQFAWKVLGAVFGASGQLDDALTANENAVRINPQDAGAHNNLGIILKELSRLEEAEATLRQAIALKSDFAEAHNSLGMTLNAMGLRESAIQHFERSHQLERGTNPVNLRHKSFINISKAKIDHDIEQFEYLAASGYDIKKFHSLAAICKTVSSEINCTLDTDIFPLSDKHQQLLGDTYNLPIHILDAPVLEESAIGKGLDSDNITEDYFSHEFGLTYVDDFLSPTTLKSLRDFLLGSTIWFDFFHSGGYMGLI